MRSKPREVVLVDGARSPMGRLGGQLARARPDDLAAAVLSALLKRNGVEPGAVDEVVLGCANQAGEDNRNVARMASLLAGFPQSVPAITVNRLCASGLDAINAAARTILSGEADLCLAGGVESMSRAPWALPKSETAFPYGNQTAYDTALGWRFPNPRMQAMFPLLSMGETAENLRERDNISRGDQDAYALESHRRAVRARGGAFKDEIVPITLEQKKAQVVVDRDEGPREDTDLEKLAKLPPAFRQGGTVSAGNSSGLSDGAAAVLLAERSRAEALGLKPALRWVGAASAGCDPSYMGLGPVLAVRRLFERIGWDVASLDRVELNEAFAAQVLACVRALKLPTEGLNVHGGAIALGHPLGASGARLAVTLLHEMRRAKAKRGLATLCVGVGQGVATAFELAGDAPPAPATVEVESRATRLLIVDDDAALAFELRDRFAKQGFTVAVAQDAAQAIAEAQSFRPDVVLLDVEMPAGGGAEAYKRLRTLDFGVKLPVIFLTGNPSKVRFTQGPYTVILKKPVDLTELDKKLRELLAKRGS